MTVTDEQFNKLQDMVGNLATLTEQAIASTSARATSQTDSAKLFYAKLKSDVPETPMGQERVNVPKWDFVQLVQKHAKNLSVGKPFSTAFTLKMGHIGCDNHTSKELSKAYFKEHGKQCPECYEQWKGLARAGKYTRTTKYYATGEYTTYIGRQYEDNVFRTLKKFGVHIPELTKEENKTRNKAIAEKLKAKEQKKMNNIGTEK